jgi:hypothetical protein
MNDTFICLTRCEVGEAVFTSVWLRQRSYCMSIAIVRATHLNPAELLLGPTVGSNLEANQSETSGYFREFCIMLQNASLLLQIKWNILIRARVQYWCIVVDSSLAIQQNATSVSTTPVKLNYLKFCLGWQL